MDTVFGIKGDGFVSFDSVHSCFFSFCFFFLFLLDVFSFFSSFVLLVADASAARSILVFKHDQDKVSRFFLCMSKFQEGSGASTCAKGRL